MKAATTPAMPRRRTGVERAMMTYSISSHSCRAGTGQVAGRAAVKRVGQGSVWGGGQNTSEWLDCWRLVHNGETGQC